MGKEDTDFWWKALCGGWYYSWHGERVEAFLEKRDWNWKDSYCCDSNGCRHLCSPWRRFWGQQAQNKLVCCFWVMV